MRIQAGLAPGAAVVDEVLAHLSLVLAALERGLGALSGLGGGLCACGWRGGVLDT